MLIATDLATKNLEPRGTFEELKKEAKIPLAEWNDPLEENVETLMVAAFQHLFGEFNLMLVSRERPLFQVADLVAIDQVGRLTVLEVKAETTNAVDIVAQATNYLVECGNMSPVQIRRAFHDFHSAFSTFGVLYYLGLLFDRRVESGDPRRESLTTYLKRRLSEEDRRRMPDSLTKGYFEFLREKSVPLVLKESKISAEGVAEHMLEQATGITNIASLDLTESSQWDFDTVFSRRFNVGLGCIDMNRQWRVVYFSPDYSFDAGIIEYLTEVYRRGMDVHFYQYRLARSSQVGPWVLGWRRTTDWMDRERLRKSFHNPEKFETWQWWKRIWPSLDEFVSGMAQEGYLVKKMPGKYATWTVAEQDLEEVDISWPNPSTRDLSEGAVFIPETAPVPSGHETLEQRLATVRRLYPVEIDKLKPSRSGKGNRLSVTWHSESDNENQHARVANKVSAEVISWFRESRR